MVVQAVWNNKKGHGMDNQIEVKWNKKLPLNIENKFGQSYSGRGPNGCKNKYKNSGFRIDRTTPGLSYNNHYLLEDILQEQH